MHSVRNNYGYYYFGLEPADDVKRDREISCYECLCAWLCAVSTVQLMMNAHASESNIMQLRPCTQQGCFVIVQRSEDMICIRLKQC